MDQHRSTGRVSEDDLDMVRLYDRRMDHIQDRFCRMDSERDRDNAMTTKSQVRLYHLSSVMIAGFLAALFVNVLTFYGPKIEGWLLPVAYTNGVDVEIIPAANKIRVSGAMSKVRSCELISSTAYISDVVGNRVIAKVETSATVKLRPIEGPVPWGPWIIDVPIWYKQAWLTITTVHQCHPLWKTESRFLQALIE